VKEAGYQSSLMKKGDCNHKIEALIGSSIKYHKEIVFLLTYKNVFTRRKDNDVDFNWGII
jgi:hypothetical protein